MPKLLASLVLAISLVMIPSVASATGGYHRDGDRDHKVTFCHNGHTVTTDYHAAWAHLKHGDERGECAPDAQPPKVPCPEPVPPGTCQTCPAGPPGPQGPQGPPGTTTTTTVVVQPKTCTSNRIDTIRIRQRAGDRITRLRASFEGETKRVKLRRLDSQRLRMKLDLRGLKKGTYVARLRYLKNGRKVTQVYYRRVCVGNGLAHENMNRRIVIRL